MKQYDTAWFTKPWIPICSVKLDTLIDKLGRITFEFKVKQMNLKKETSLKDEEEKERKRKKKSHGEFGRNYMNSTFL